MPAPNYDQMLEQIGKLSRRGYKVYNVNEGKAPTAHGALITAWPTRTAAYFQENLIISPNERYGMLMGPQENGDFIISLDFDCCGDKGPDGQRLVCQYTTAKWVSYLENIDRRDGMYSSSTQGNYNVLINMKNSSLLPLCTGTTFADHHLEVLINKNQVIPPSRTLCKVTGKLGAPRYSDNFQFFYELRDADTFLTSFLKELFANRDKKSQPGPEVERPLFKPQLLKFTLFHRQILENIPKKHWQEYDLWIRAIWALKFTFEDALDIADEFSKGPNYVSKRDVAEKMKLGVDPDIGWGYLEKLSRESNPRRHAIIQSLNKIDDTDWALAQQAILIVDTVVKVNGQIYVYEGGFWTLDEKKERVNHVLNRALRNLWKEIQGLYFQEDRDDKLVQAKITACGKVLVKLGSDKARTQITSSFFKDIPEKDIIFDENPNLFCFKDAAFDLTTNSRVQLKPSDYVTQNTHYAYEEATEEEMADFTAFWDSIFPNAEIGRSYKSILRTCLSGRPQEKFIMCYGSGGNGKGAINELVELMLGKDYFYGGNITTLTTLPRGGVNVEMALMDRKRCIRFKEVEGSNVLQVSVLKDITGGGTINARLIYSTKTEVKLQGTVILECNEQPGLSGAVDAALIRRFVTPRFETEFTANPTLPHQRRGNARYKDPAWQKRAKHCLFQFLMQETDVKIYEPRVVQIASMSYLTGADEFAQHMDRYYVVTDSELDAVSIKDITCKYKQTLNPHGKVYKKCTGSFVVEKLKTNVKWGPIYAANWRARVRRPKDAENVMVMLREIDCGM
jgi:hypothetical protein